MVPRASIGRPGNYREGREGPLSVELVHWVDALAVTGEMGACWW
jgi:hypothetical protein